MHKSYYIHIMMTECSKELTLIEYLNVNSTANSDEVLDMAVTWLDKTPLTSWVSTDLQT